MYAPDNLHLIRAFLDHTPRAVALLDRELHYLLVTRQWLRDCALDEMATTSIRDATEPNNDRQNPQQNPRQNRQQNRQTPLNCGDRSHAEILEQFKQRLGVVQTDGEDESETERHWDRVRQNVLAGKVERWQEHYRLRDGSGLVVEWEACPWTDERGEIGGLLLVRDERSDPETTRPVATDANAEEAVERSRANERELHRQSQALVKLARSKTQKGENLKAALREISATAADILKTSQVSIWLYNNERSRLRCIERYTASSPPGDRPANNSIDELRASDFPDYLHALDLERAIAVVEAQTDGISSELARSYLIPSEITSLLSVPIRIGGKLVGFVACEHRGTPRRWQLGEQNFAASVGDYTALAIESSVSETSQRARARAQDNLKKANEQLQAVLDAVPGCISWFSSDLTYLGVNDYLAKTFDRAPDSFIGKKIGFLQGSPRFNQLVPEFFENPAREDRNEIQIEVGDSTRHFLVVAQKYQQGDAAVFVGLDITDRKQAEAALQKVNGELELRVEERTAQLQSAIAQLREEIESRQRIEEARDVLEFSINNAADAVFWLTPEGEFFYVNDAACIALNYARDELLDLTVHDINPDLPPEVWPDYWEEIKSFGSVRLESSHRTKEGTIFPVEITISYFKVNGKEYNCIFARDISDRKRVEAQLYHAKAAAEAANKAKLAFLANMSHELRTPLTAIIGYSDLLQEDAIDLGLGETEFVNDLGSINKAGIQLLDAIEQILDYSKIELGKMDLEISTFELSELVKDLKGTVKPLAIANYNSLGIHVDDRVPTMRGDRAKVKQVLTHLLVNATKFTEHGAIELEITWQDTPDFRSLNSSPHSQLTADVNNEGWIVFRVVDTGIGISEEQMEHLFEAFSQVDSSSTRRYGGTGVGLALSSSLCQLMGGDLFVESEIGVGSTFTVCLPVKLAAPAATAPAGSTEGSISESASAPFLVPQLPPAPDDFEIEDDFWGGSDSATEGAIAGKESEQPGELEQQVEPQPSPTSEPPDAAEILDVAETSEPVPSGSQQTEAVEILPDDIEIPSDWDDDSLDELWDFQDWNE